MQRKSSTRAWSTARSLSARWPQTERHGPLWPWWRTQRSSSGWPQGGSEGAGEVMGRNAWNLAHVSHEQPCHHDPFLQVTTPAPQRPGAVLRG